MLVGPPPEPVWSAAVRRMRTLRLVAELVAQYQKLSVLIEFGSGAGLHAEVHLLLHAGGERVDEGDGSEALGRRQMPFRQPRSEIEAVEIAAEARFDIGAQHFHRDCATIGGHGAVNLCDRGCANRLFLD